MYQAASRIMMKSEAEKLLIFPRLWDSWKCRTIKLRCSQGRNNWFFKINSQGIGSRNIQVNVVAPGFIDTDMTGLSENKK